MQRLDEFLKGLLDLSAEEEAVIDAVRSFQMPVTAVRIVRLAGVNRQMTNRILKSFVTRQLVLIHRESGRHDRFRYNKKVSRCFNPSPPRS